MTYFFPFFLLYLSTQIVLSEGVVLAACSGYRIPGDRRFKTEIIWDKVANCDNIVTKCSKFSIKVDQALEPNRAESSNSAFGPHMFSPYN